MRVGSIISVPNQYSEYGRVLDGYGVGYTVEKGALPEDAEVGDSVAYKVELWGGDSGIVYNVEDD